MIPTETRRVIEQKVLDEAIAVLERCDVLLMNLQATPYERGQLSGLAIATAIKLRYDHTALPTPQENHDEHI